MKNIEQLDSGGEHVRWKAVSLGHESQESRGLNELDMSRDIF